MIRKPVVAGKFYPATKTELIKEIKESFTTKFGPGKVPELKNDKIIGIIVPHAGYAYSGPCAAHGFAELPRDAKTFVILATNHTGMGEPVALCSSDEWETPLGNVKVDQAANDLIIKSCPFAKKDVYAQKYEHSAEVQLPFLQFLFKDFKIIPIVIAHNVSDSEISKLAQCLPDVPVIASSDFTHYGYAYDFHPFSGDREQVRQKMYDLDYSAISAIKKLDYATFTSVANKTTICGTSPIRVLIKLAQQKKAKKVELLQYYTSGDLLGDYSNAVGYAAMVVRQ